MKLFLLSLLLLNLALNADDKYLMRIAYGTADKNDLGEIMTGNSVSTDKPLSVVAVDGGYLLKHRSGIAGLINNVDHGGSNYNAFYIEKKF